jgi:hypothetical protein
MEKNYSQIPSYKFSQNCKLTQIKNNMFTQNGPFVDNNLCKYKKMINEMLKINVERGMNLNVSCNKTLYELMHSQSRFPLQTAEDEMDKILQLNTSDCLNDTFEFFYTKNYTITPLLYRIIICSCSPDEVFNCSIGYPNQKAIIFNYTDIFDRSVFDKEFLYPFFESEVFSLIQAEIEQFENNSQKTSQVFVPPAKELLYKEYMRKIYDNIYIINYLDLVELILKLQDLPNIIRKIKDVSLVIVDSPNLLLNQTLNYEYDDEIVKEEIQTRKSNLTIHKKRKKSLKGEEIGITEQMNKVINNIQTEFNFNLIYTLFDFDRISELNYLKYKLNKQFDNKKCVNVKIGDEDRCEFIFHLKDIQDKHKIYSLEPIPCYVNCNINMFGYVIYVGEGHFIFKAFMKTKGVNEIKKMIEHII